MIRISLRNAWCPSMLALPPDYTVYNSSNQIICNGTKCWLFPSLNVSSVWGWRGSSHVPVAFRARFWPRASFSEYAEEPLPNLICLFSCLADCAVYRVWWRLCGLKWGVWSVDGTRGRFDGSCLCYSSEQKNSFKNSSLIRHKMKRFEQEWFYFYLLIFYLRPQRKLTFCN